MTRALKDLAHRPPPPPPRPLPFPSKFLNNDALEVDWSDADVVFMNSTCFTQSLMIDLSYACKNLKDGAFIITTTRRVIGPSFLLLEEIKMEESWGDATVYIQQRVQR